MKVVLNKCYGGFSLSNAAYEALIKKGWKVTFYNEQGNHQDRDADICDGQGGEYPSKWCRDDLRYSLVCSRRDKEIRAHADLVEVVEQLGDKANGRCAALEVVEIPDGVSWQIEEYDGMEHIAEKHRTWG